MRWRPPDGGQGEVGYARSVSAGASARRLGSDLSVEDKTRRPPDGTGASRARSNGRRSDGNLRAIAEGSRLKYFVCA
jgi:hypothetical protein